MTSSANSTASAQWPAFALSVGAAVTLTSLLVFLVSPEIGKLLILALCAVIGLVAFLRHTHWALLLMLAIGPFYDFARAVLFPNTALVGAWQDIAVIGFVIAAIGNTRRPDFKWSFSYLDCAVVVYIAAYAFSALLTSNLAVWFYGFRWSTLYAFFYLALKTFRFTDRGLKRIVSVTAGALVASIMIGYWMIMTLGNQAYFALLGALGFTVFGRAGEFRWPATFGHPLVASTSFALVLIISTAYLLEEKRTGLRWFYSGIAIMALLACAATLSRLGWAVGGVGVMGALWVNRGRFRANKKAALLCGFVAVLGIAIVALAEPEMFAIATQMSDFDNLRIQSFRAVLGDSIRYPLGVGLGTAGAVSSVAREFGGQLNGVEAITGDSVLLQVLRDTGWIGFFALLAVCIGFIRKALQGFQGSSSPQIRLLTLTTFAFSLGLLANLMNVADVWPTKFYFWLFGALSVAVVEGRVSREDSAALTS